MLRWRIEYALQTNLWYTFDGPLLRGVEVYDRRLVEKLQQQPLRPSDISMSCDPINSSTVVHII